MKIISIQFLRAVAVCLVVYEHSMAIQMDFSPSIQQNILHLKSFGCIGVDLFFVISGFIITFVGNEYHGKKGALDFLIKRFERINPVYYVCSLLFVIMLAIYMLIMFGSIQIPINNLLNALCDTLLIIPTSKDVNLFAPVLKVGWTLSFEWFFYILYFSAIILKPNRRFQFLLFMIILLIAIGYLFKPGDYRTAFFTNPIMLEFLLGATIYKLYKKSNPVSVSISIICLLTGIAMYILLIIYGIGDAWNYKNVLNGHLSIQRFLLWGIPSSLIVAGSVFLEKNRRLLKVWNNRWMLLVGDASYVIYLTHSIVFLFLITIYKRFHVLLPADLNIYIQLFLCIIIGIWFYKWLEKPILVYVKKHIAAVRDIIAPLNTRQEIKSKEELTQTI